MERKQNIGGIQCGNSFNIFPILLDFFFYLSRMKAGSRKSWQNRSYQWRVGLTSSQCGLFFGEMNVVGSTAGQRFFLPSSASSNWRRQQTEIQASASRLCGPESYSRYDHKWLSCCVSVWPSCAANVWNLKPSFMSLYSTHYISYVVLELRVKEVRWGLSQQSLGECRVTP